MKALLMLLLLGMGARADNVPTPALTAKSIYNLDAKLTTQAGKHIGLDLYRGQPVLISMFYGSCPLACPLLIDTLRSSDTSR